MAEDESTKVVHEDLPRAGNSPLPPSPALGESAETIAERFAELYFHAPVGYLILDKEGVIQELNFLAAELLGQSRKSLLGSQLVDELSSKNGPIITRHLRDLFEATGVQHCQLSVNLSDQVTTHLKMLSVAINDPVSGELQCRAALYDITEEVKAQNHRDELQEQLRQAHRMEALGRMTSGIAHDFNNLLTLVIGYSKLLLNQLPEDSPFRSHAGQINKAGHQASELIEQLLAYSRSQSVSPSPVKVNGLVKDMKNMFDRLVGDDIDLRLRLDEEIGLIRFDSVQLQQVLMNLVVNAREVMPRGGELIIRTRNCSVNAELAGRLDITPGSYIVIEVEDSGPAIPESLIPHLFDPFFARGDMPRPRSFGLATSNDIIRQHNGAIGVESSYGRGTTFGLYLPRTDVSEQSQTALESPCVLVVDDQPDLREFASLVLAELDIELLSAQSPDEALQLARTYGGHIDLVVTDVIMPGMNGPQLMERIQQSHPDAMALYISGHDRETICQDKGIDPNSPFLEKPFSPENLSEMVRSLLDTRAQHSDL